MAHCNTVFNQMLQIFSRHEFDQLAKKHHVGQKFRSFSRWSQFGALFMGQLMGFTNISRATLARTNEKQPASLYEELFTKPLKRCRHLAPGNRFKLKNLYLLDSSTIDLCLSVFPWATFRENKGAIKLHMGLNADGYLPTFVNMTEASSH